jgi:F-type H+-transporting ATPase subunit gamma
MALGLLDIKRRIRSVKNTQKITRAVSMVATSKFGKVRARLYRVNPYYEGFKDAVNRMLLSGTLESPYLKPGNSEKDLYIVITSDSGMCGNYN